MTYPLTVDFFTDCSAVGGQGAAHFNVYTDQFDTISEDVRMYRDGVLLATVPLVDSGFPGPTPPFTFAFANYDDEPLTNGFYTWSVKDQDDEIVWSFSDAITCGSYPFEIDYTFGCAEDGSGAYVNFEITYTDVPPVEVRLIFDDGLGGVEFDSATFPPSPQTLRAEGLEDGNYPFTLEADGYGVIYSVNPTFECGTTGPGVYDAGELHIPYKDWAYPHDRSIAHHEQNWFKIEQWARTIHCEARTNGVDWELLPLHIPYKTSPTQAQSENNYFVFERWANQVCYPIHIPYKKWGFENNGEGDHVHEEINLLTIERWSKLIGQCCENEGTPTGS